MSIAEPIPPGGAAHHDMLEYYCLTRHVRTKSHLFSKKTHEFK
jgi:hypothetical protein